MSKLRIGIIGATGYTGSELVRILHQHPEAQISIITSESKAGQKFSTIHKSFTGFYDNVLQPMKEVEQTELDVVFLALPHGVSMNYVKQFHDHGHKIIDLSGDFRLRNSQTYQQWYGKEHEYEAGFNQGIYGLPELFRERIKASRLVANPGCYPTSSILSILPLVKEHIIDTENIIIDAKSGTTGAGISPKSVTLFGNVNDNFKPYGLKSHRHTIEIEEQLNATVQFTPHLLPIDRGIITTSYSKPKTTTDSKELTELYRDFYGKEKFIRVRSEVPSVKEVRGTNFCDVYITYDDRTGNIITVGAIDNLVKGASGQAVQNMNLMFELPEDEGLKALALIP